MQRACAVICLVCEFLAVCTALVHLLSNTRCCLVQLVKKVKFVLYANFPATDGNTDACDSSTMKRSDTWWTYTTLLQTLVVVYSACAVTSAADTFCPSLCHCSDLVTSCRNVQLTEVPRDVPPDSISLILDSNAILALRNGSVSGTIRSLSIQYNGLRRLETAAFAALPHLSELLLAGNRLRSLPQHVFRHNPLLRVLDLHSNAFATLPDGAFTPLIHLGLLNLGYNRLTELRLGPGMRRLTQLASLDFSGNQIARLGSDAFREAMHWDASVARTLNMSACGLRRIHRNALATLPGLASLSLSANIHVAQHDLEGALNTMNTTALRRLDLSRTNASDVYPFFRRAELRGLEYLGLAMNGIRSLQSATFFYLVQLRELDLSHNRLEVLSDLGELTQLRRLSLGYNYLSRLSPAAFEGLPQLTFLDLSHNALATLTEAPFVALWSLAELDVSCNRLQSVSIRGGLESLRKLHLHSNRITHLNFIERLLRLQELDASNNVITRVPAATFTNSHALELVNLSANAIYDMSARAFRGSAVHIVDLSHNRLLWLGHHGWRQIRKLFLQANYISNVSATALRGFSQLQTLHLADNHLTSLPQGVFEDLPGLQELHLESNPLASFLQNQPEWALNMHPDSQVTWLSLAHTGLAELSPRLLASFTSLRSLDLSDNSLESISPTTFASQVQELQTLNLAGNQLSAPDPDSFASLHVLRDLDLSGNPLHCSCQLIPFRDWLAQTTLTSSAYQCAAPPEWRGVELNAFDLNTTACRHHERVTIIAAAAAAACLIIIIAASVAICRYRCIRSRKTKLNSTQYCAMTNTLSVRVNGYPPKQCI